MATIRIYRDEAAAEDMPPLCMKCGAAADECRPQKFAWMPAWAHLFLFVGLLPWLIAALITRKTMWVEAPMCPRHVNHWRVRKLYVGLGLIWWIAYAIGLAVVAKQLDDEVLGAMFGFLLLGGLAWLVGGLLLVNSAIRAAEIRDGGMELTHVHRDFARAWNESRPDPPPSRRGRPRRAAPVRPDRPPASED